MDIPKVIFFLLLQFFIINGRNNCPSSFCGNNSFPIKYPFRIEGQQANNCSNHGGFNLKCNSQGIAVLTLPYSGDFFVRNINYVDREIQVYDPENCIPRRLLNFSLSTSYSPFIAVANENYIFLNCPPEIVRWFTPVACLSNSSVYVIATSSRYYASILELYMMCNVTSTLMIPVARFSQYENGFYGDLFLTWNTSRKSPPSPVPSSTGNSGRQNAFKYVGYIIFLSFVILATLLISILSFKCISERRRRRRISSFNSAAATTLTSQPTLVITSGLDASTIESCTKVVVLGEGGQIPGTSHMTCPICLADYRPKETVRCMPECQHYFHAECIDEWLRMKGICPVCRNALAPVNSNHDSNMATSV